MLGIWYDVTVMCVCVHAYTNVCNDYYNQWSCDSGLEVAIHAVHHSLSVLGNDNSPALFKIDIKNAFNECNRTSFLDRVSEDFPEIAPWVHWCYSQPAELHTLETYSGIYRCSAGDLLGPLLFSLVLVQFLNSNPLDEACLLSLWCLDDGFL